VTARLTFGFPGPDIKMPPAIALPLGARIIAARQDDRFAQTNAGHFIPVRHLSPVSAKEPDFVAVAERLTGAPYLWGGKTGDGIDCSGLVQIALQTAGVFCPRDSDMQEFALGHLSSLGELRRGDLVFWKGHVAIVRDKETLIHANAHHMMVVSEPAEAAITRIKATGSDVTSVRRP
ncbi:MAG: C40 family peptidase, partial [Pseudolabrys sp.]|nr:C40 family peptidase [Pseudolabrys sp.]